MVKSTDSSSRRSRFDSHQPYGSSQPSVTPVPGYLTPSSGLLRHCIHMVDRTRMKQRREFCSVWDRNDLSIFLGVRRKGFGTVAEMGANGSEARTEIALNCEGRNVGFSMERLNQ